MWFRYAVMGGDRAVESSRLEKAKYIPLCTGFNDVAQYSVVD